MNNKILTDVKKHLGLEDDYTCFDPDVIIGINSAFMNLTDLGVGPEIPFRIESGDETWEDFFGEETNPGKLALLGFIKEYIPLRTRLMFDPPTSGFVLDAIQKRIDELEWRMNINAEELEEAEDDV